MGVVRYNEASSAQTIHDVAQRLAADTAAATGSTRNESSLRARIEPLIHDACEALSIAYVPFQFDVAVRGQRAQSGFVDVVYGGVIIEYKSPNAFQGGARKQVIAAAMDQVQEYASHMAVDEGRPLADYTLVVWDGAHIAFGQTDGDDSQWERLAAFDGIQAERLLNALDSKGRPLVHPGLLRAAAGPESEVGALLLPALFDSVRAADEGSASGTQTKTTLLLREWQRLFGQAVGMPTQSLAKLLQRQCRQHDRPYADHVACYLFALHTLIALTAKIVAALALPRAGASVTDEAVDLRDRMHMLESGQLFSESGITNMLSGDFFSWPADDANWPAIKRPLGSLLLRLGDLSFDMSTKSSNSVRDLFKGLYQEFVPRELRHALGEVYTPDWLAAHALDAIDWEPHDDLLDPTCGTGTFLLEALSRRLEQDRHGGASSSASTLLRGLYGIDLNPVAVLAAKASLVLELSSRLNGSEEITLPVFLGDAINVASVSDNGDYIHRIQTEKGDREFRLPASIAESGRLFGFFDRLRLLLLSGLDDAEVEAQSQRYAGTADDSEKAVAVAQTVRELLDLHRRRWDGIWCPIIADRFAVAAIPEVSHIAGNPPWVKWAHLPEKYAAFVKPLCEQVNVFSDHRYAGGIESDISTVITFQSVRRWLAPGGRLAFYITATVFSNESSQGFRLFQDSDGNPICRIDRVEDFKQINPFRGVTNHAALLLLTKVARNGESAFESTVYPVTYRLWRWPSSGGSAGPQRCLSSTAQSTDLQAVPVPGKIGGPWLKGTSEQLERWSRLFDAQSVSIHRARKGVTTDRNGIFFVRALGKAEGGMVSIENDPALGRVPGIAKRRATIEAEHVFPLLRGRGVSAFRAVPDAEYSILVPQRGMHGDPLLPETCPQTYRYLSNFRATLQARASYRRYQQGKPWWSTWSTGEYTFSEYKVLWKEMSGSRFCAAYVGKVDDPVLGKKIAVADHKLYMVPVANLAEAQFLTAALNAPTVAQAVSAYAAALSLGTTVTEYLRIPAYDPDDSRHKAIASVAGEMTDACMSRPPHESELDHLDTLVLEVLS